MLKKLILAAALAVGASMAHAATCTVGSCSTDDLEGQLLSTEVHFDVNDIVGVGVTSNGDSGAFTFNSYFINDTTFDGAAAVAFLVSTLQGAISDLTLNILNAGISKSYSLANDSETTILLADLGAPPQQIDFTLTGIATRGTKGGDPDINLTISPVPLPAGVLLFGTALAGFGVVRRRKTS